VFDGTTLLPVKVSEIIIAIGAARFYAAHILWFGCSRHSMRVGREWIYVKPFAATRHALLVL
jgi:hypothetical protein